MFTKNVLISIPTAGFTYKVPMGPKKIAPPPHHSYLKVKKLLAGKLNSRSQYKICCISRLGNNTYKLDGKIIKNIIHTKVVTV